MALDPEIVRNIARLSRIELKDDEIGPLAGELSRIVAFVEQLAEVDTDGVAPMTSVAHMEMPRREDKVTDGNRRDDILANAPDQEDGFFLVPKVVE
jgi:aspartyl-tRNA(Asn)/glutamyl-tRNA(Gln) amidotransferase subunit C